MASFDFQVLQYLFRAVCDYEFVSTNFETYLGSNFSLWGMNFKSFNLVVIDQFSDFSFEVLVK